MGGYNVELAEAERRRREGEGGTPIPTVGPYTPTPDDAVPSPPETPDVSGQLTNWYQSNFGRAPSAQELASDAANAAKYGISGVLQDNMKRVSNQPNQDAYVDAGPVQRASAPSERPVRDAAPANFPLANTQFDDPYTNLLERVALAQLEQAMQPLDTSGFDQLSKFLTERFTELSSSPGFSPAEQAMMRTQVSEPIEANRRASMQRARERAAARGFANPTGLAELDMRDIDQQADRTRTAADRDLAITGMNQRRGDLNQAMQSAVQLAQLPQQRRAMQTSSQPQALNLATLLYQLPAQAQAQAMSVINGTAPPSSLLNTVMAMNQQKQQQQNALWQTIGSLAGDLFGGG